MYIIYKRKIDTHIHVCTKDIKKRKIYTKFLNVYHLSNVTLDEREIDKI